MQAGGQLLAGRPLRTVANHREPDANAEARRSIRDRTDQQVDAFQDRHPAEKHQ